jgi:hypothetical protein
MVNYVCGSLDTPGFFPFILRIQTGRAKTGGRESNFLRFFREPLLTFPVKQSKRFLGTGKKNISHARGCLRSAMPIVRLAVKKNAVAYTSC